MTDSLINRACLPVHRLRARKITLSPKDDPEIPASCCSSGAIADFDTEHVTRTDDFHALTSALRNPNLQDWVK